MRSAAACRIISASSDVTLPSPLTSHRRSSGRLPAAIWSAITASAVVNAMRLGPGAQGTGSVSN